MTPPHKLCNGCRVPRAMQFCGLMCGPFLWRADVCDTCHEAAFKNPIHALGFKLTQFMFKDGVIYLPPAARDA